MNQGRSPRLARGTTLMQLLRRSTSSAVQHPVIRNRAPVDAPPEFVI
jgi:hypothetical protein